MGIFNLGGLIGALLAIPLAKMLGRRVMFGSYFAASAVAILSIFALALQPQVRLGMMFVTGLAAFGMYGAFTSYLPELFPTRVRATGLGFADNFGRIIAAAGPFVVGTAALRGVALQALFCVGFVPLIGAPLSPLYIETRGQALAD